MAAACLHSKETADKFYGKISHDKKTLAAREYVYTEAMKLMDKNNEGPRRGGTTTTPTAGVKREALSAAPVPPSTPSKKPRHHISRVTFPDRENFPSAASSSSSSGPHQSNDVIVLDDDAADEPTDRATQPPPPVLSVVGLLAPGSTAEKPAAMFGVVQQCESTQDSTKAGATTYRVRLAALAQERGKAPEAGNVYRMQIGASYVRSVRDLVYPIDYMRDTQGRYIIFTTAADMHSYLRSQSR